jgi:hypothetical protein
MGAGFLTTREGSYKHGKREEQNEPCSTGFEFWIYQYEVMII